VLPLGQPFLKSVYTILDFDKGQVGLAPPTTSKLRNGQSANFEETATSAAVPLLSTMWAMFAVLLAFMI
jgi:hypothetical protein